jgi:multicomponent Na+:H+ antiporter subunit C
MTLLLSLLVGALVSSGIYMMLRRSVVDLVFGLMLLSHAANLLVFTSGGVRRGAPPLLGHGAPELMSDPLPQALVLTAIVIGFGLTAFALVLVAVLCGVEKTDDSEEMPTQ